MYKLITCRLLNLADFGPLADGHGTKRLWDEHKV